MRRTIDDAVTRRAVVVGVDLPLAVGRSATWRSTRRARDLWKRQAMAKEETKTMRERTP